MYTENPCLLCGCSYNWHYEKTYKNYEGKEYTMSGCDAPLGYNGDEPCMCGGFKPKPYKAKFDLNGLVLD